VSDDKNDDERRWWEDSWTEREDAMWEIYGPSHPVGAAEGYVTSYDWADVPLPGACCYTFPPRPVDAVRQVPAQAHWIYGTHGLAQWGTREEMALARQEGDRLSGPGYEFAIIVDQAAPWAPGLLRSLMAYDQKQRAAGGWGMRPGDRMPFQFEAIEEDDTRWMRGGASDDANAASDGTRSLMFWRYLCAFGTITTSTGSFELRVATTITGEELQLAKATSSCHLLLLLEWAGVGQRSVPGRACATQRPGWELAWADIAKLPFDETKRRLGELAKRRIFP
jgi:hypothetical protein